MIFSCLVLLVCISGFLRNHFVSLSSYPQIGQALRPALKGMGFWNSVMELARAYECMMSLVIYMAIVVLSWFPFMSEFQIRLLFNQAFSRSPNFHDSCRKERQKIIIHLKISFLEGFTKLFFYS